MRTETKYMDRFNTIRNIFLPRPIGCFLFVLIACLLFPTLESFGDAQGHSQSVTQDWLVSSDPLAMPISPTHGATVKQNPPIFRWPYSQGQGSYLLRLKTAGGQVREFQTEDNWVFLPSLLAPGDYQWQVRKKSHSSTWSNWRSFYVAQVTYPFLVPDPKTLFEKARLSSRPRLFPKGIEKKQLVNELLTGSRKPSFLSLVSKVKTFSQSTFSENELLSLDHAGGFNIQGATQKVNHQALHAAYTWMITGKSTYLQEAKARALAMAKLDPHGGTGRENGDLTSQEIALTLSSIYDLLYDEFSEQEKGQIRKAIIDRVQDLHAYYIAHKTHGLGIHPFSSHGIRHAGAISAIATLLAGDVEEAQSWFMSTFPLYSAILSPWGGEDGGHANGTNYAVWDVFTFIIIGDILKETTGVDFSKTAWFQEFSRYLTYFLPPGSPSNVFGDGQSIARPGLWPWLAAVIAQRASNPIAWRYDEVWGHPNSIPYLSYLFGPLSLKSTIATNLPNGALFSSIGWAAFHSNLDNPNRTSIYFKSSPYGSFNHSHADQNSFVIYSQGRPLAIASGYYDSYWSPHHESWTIQTKAHNAITVDGGIGQKSKSIAAKGRIARFEDKGEYGYVVGDASQAYNGLIKKAIRTVMYIRPNSLLVYDLLESELPRQWEWNIHSVNQFTQKNGAIRFENAPASACIKDLTGEDLTFHQTHQFPVNPINHSQRPQQWHGTYKTTNLTKKHEFLFHVRIDCGNANIKDVKALSEGGYTFEIENQPGKITASSASFMNKDNTPPTVPRNVQIY